MKFERFWTIPVLAIYLYALTVLAQYGFDSYFHIPSDFVQASISANTIFVHSLLKALIGIPSILKSWQLIVGGFLFVIIVVCVYFFPSLRDFLSLLLIGYLLLFLYNAYGFGHLIASNGAYFPAVPSNCVEGVTSSTESLIIPTFYGSNAILVPVDAINTMIGGFIVRDTASLPCAIQYRSIGPIKSPK